MATEVVKHNGGAELQKHGFGETELKPYAETAATAVAAREQAAIQARFVVAMQRPRNTEAFRVSLLNECRRPAFAEVARYKKPIGGSAIEGPSIRFVETALRLFRNVSAEVTTVYDDNRMRICRVSVIDLEGNDGYATEIQVTKTVERKNGKGRVILGERSNSYGEKVFIVEATDDEVITKQNALISKAIRTQGLRLLPGDIVEEAQNAVIAALSKEVIDDPRAALRKIIDAFDAKGVKPEDLSMWAGGKPLERLTPAEMTDLRACYQAIRDGEATWEEIMDAKAPEGSQGAADEVAKRKLEAFKKAKDAAETKQEDAAETTTATTDKPKQTKFQMGKGGTENA